MSNKEGEKLPKSNLFKSSLSPRLFNNKKSDSKEKSVPSKGAYTREGISRSLKHKK